MAEVPTGVTRAAMVSVDRDMPPTESGGITKSKNKAGRVDKPKLRA